MEIVIGKTAGFCFGVRNAVENALKTVAKEKNVYCLGELTHNKQVMQKIEESGAKVVDTLEEVPNNAKLIIRAHGVAPETYSAAKEKGLEILDLTCPRVLKIHEQAEEYKNKGYYIFLIAEAIHPEAIGTIGFCGENAYIIENKDMVSEAIEKYKNSKCSKVAVLAQTTFSMQKFDEIAEMLIQELAEIEINKTICNATNLRQTETVELAKTVDLMIVIGGRNSSNTKKLYEISSQNCANALLIETYEEIDKEYIKQFKKIGVMAGASTPKESIDDVINMLEETEGMVC